jgi:hypothetical protein
MPVKPPLSLRWLPVLALVCAPVTHAEESPAPDPWLPMARFVGEWQGTASGEAGSGRVTRHYAKALGGRFIQESNTTTYPPQEKNKNGEVHEHSGMFSYDKGRNTLVLRQFHIEGFVNTYRQSSLPGADKLVFESENFENFSNSWKARETYEFIGDDQFVEVFELAPPGKPFQVYSRTELKRIR